MKRLLTLILALLMAATLAGGVKSTVLAEEENPYLGLWEMTGGQQGEIYLSRDQMAGSGYLYFLPNGVVYGIVIEGEYISEDYAGYRVTGENALELNKDDFTVCGVYDPETGVLALTDSGESLTVFAERVKADPLPDIWAMADH